MSRRALIIIGGGEHATVVAEAADGALPAWDVTGYIAPHCDEKTDAFGLRWLGTDAHILAAPPRDVSFVLGLGEIGLRRHMARTYTAAGITWGSVVHSRAWVSASACLGSGIVVLPGAVVHTRAIVGDHCIVNSCAVIEHDVGLGAHSHAGPGVAVGGGARIGEGVFLGLGARIRDHVTLGDDAVVGMGAVVTSDVGAAMTVVGCPARETPRRRETR